MTEAFRKIPLITVGITCFNAGATIERAVKSALAQDWPELEIVAVDDCSADDSWERLVDFSSVDSRLRLFRHDTNKGYPAALNTILSHARGQFVAFFDDDDDNVPDRLKAQVERITNYEQKTGAEIVFCYANRNVVKGGESVADHVALAIGRSAPEPFGPEVADHIFGIRSAPGKTWGLFGSCTLMARRASFEAVGSFDQAFRRCAEWDIAVRASFLGAHFIAVDRPLITMHKTGGADKAGTIPLKYSLLIRDKYRKYLSERGLYLASKFIAHSNFYGNKNRIFKAYMYRIFAYLSSPELILYYFDRRMKIRK